MIWDGHGLESDLLGILEEGVWTPNQVKPLNWQQSGKMEANLKFQFIPEYRST